MRSTKPILILIPCRREYLDNVRKQGQSRQPLSHPSVSRSYGSSLKHLVSKSIVLDHSLAEGISRNAQVEFDDQNGVIGVTLVAGSGVRLAHERVALEDVLEMEREGRGRIRVGEVVFEPKRLVAFLNKNLVGKKS